MNPIYNLGYYTIFNEKNNTKLQNSEKYWDIIRFLTKKRYKTPKFRKVLGYYTVFNEKKQYKTSKFREMFSFQ